MFHTCAQLLRQFRAAEPVKISWQSTPCSLPASGGQSKHSRPTAVMVSLNSRELWAEIVGIKH